MQRVVWRFEHLRFAGVLQRIGVVYIIAALISLYTTRRPQIIITLAILTALRAENEIPMHVRAAINNGLTPEEIREVIMHTAVYAGVPAANSAMALAQKTLYE